MYKTQVIIQAGGLASEANKCPGEAPPAHVCQCSVWAEGPCGGLDVSAAYLRQASKLLGAKPPPLHSRLSKLRHASEASKWLGRSPSAHVCQSSVRAEGPDGGLDVTVNALSITLKSLHLKKRTRLSKASKVSKWLGAKPSLPPIHLCQSSVMRAKRANGWGEALPHMFVKAPSGPKALTEV